ncbi:MAG: triphosphoribosyl-dephospho-CoA synthase, partial [Candidatus Bathyarchaeia archaeon]
MATSLRDLPIHSVVDTVTNAIQLALLLEVSAYPKPGNVHRTADLTDLSYEQFLAAIVSMSPTFRSAALRGARCASGELTIEEIRVGALIKDAVERMMSSQGG